MVICVGVISDDKMDGQQWQMKPDSNPRLRGCGKAEILRSEELEERQRKQFVMGIEGVVGDWAGDGPPTRSRRLLKWAASFAPDAFYTLATICVCRRRLGEEYTYIAMHKPHHYLSEGVLLNQRTRLLLAILQLVFRHAGNHLLKSTLQSLSDSLGDSEEIASQTQWLVLMAYMLNWTKCSSLLESLLGVEYVYTFETAHVVEVSYLLEGYLLLFIFLFKVGRFIFQNLKRKPQLIAVQEVAETRDSPICRICLEPAQNESAAVCGHIFCWECIIQSLRIKNQCPLCRKQCLPRKVIRLS